MKISHSWLQQFINIPISPQETSSILTDIGLEIEKLEKVEAVKGGLAGLVVGEVLTCEKHPDADKLKLTTVNVGTGEPLNIVCGAPNVATNKKVIVATVGTTLYPTEGDAFKIKKSKIRGHESHGMLCAEDEIGLGKGHDGITLLADDVIPGTPISKVFDLQDDWVYEIGLTPNRADAMSHYGVARDLVVALKHKGIIANDVQMCTPATEQFKTDNTDLTISIDVKNAEACPRYAGVTISGVTVTDSPDWIKQRLLSIGLSPINNIVDITNYVLHELGQPLHAFDAAKIPNKQVIVQTVANETTFTTLDDTERKLNENDLMICNSIEPMCIAGVFGGATSGVSKETTSVFLESAYFHPVSVRKTAKRHGLNTDASFRFERGIDPDITIYALKRAALLIKEIAGGSISSEIQEFYPTPINSHKVEFNIERCNKLIGKEIPTDTILNILNLLGLNILKQEGNQLTLEVQAFRNDVTREADVVEEVLRIYGFNNIDLPSKLNTSIAYSDKIDKESTLNTTMNFLSSNGFAEIMSNSLTKSSYLTDNPVKKLSPDHSISLLNPLSKDLDVLRQSLLFNGLEAIAYNQNRQQADLKLYEYGKTYHKYPDGFEENQYINLFITGKEQGENWNTTSDKADFYSLKENVINVLNRLGIYKNASANETKSPEFDYGMSISINKKKVVDFGLVKQSILTSFGIKNPVYSAEINWTVVLDLLVMNKTKYKALTKYPSSRRDLSLLLDNQVSFEEIKEIATRVDRKLLKEVGLFDIYQGKNLAEGKKSYAVSFLFRDDNKTVQDKQIDKIMAKIQSGLESQLGATLR